MNAFKLVLGLGLTLVASLPSARANLVLVDDDRPGCGGEVAPAPVRPRSTDVGWFTDADELADSQPASGSFKPLTALPAFKRDFCGRTDADIAGAPNRFSQLATVAFSNPPGQFNTGLCLYHSRLQRRLVYLASFRPDKPKPTPAQAACIIDRLHSGRGVTEVPGYRNIYDFTHDYEKQLTAKLDADSVKAILDGQAEKRLFDSSKRSTAAEMSEVMRDIYSDYLGGSTQATQGPRMVFLRIKDETMNLFVQHAWLVTSMEPILGSPAPGNSLAATRVVGYRLKILDSNFSLAPIDVEFHDGDLNLHVDNKMLKLTNVNIYRDHDDDLAEMHGSIRDYCDPREQQEDPCVHPAAEYRLEARTWASR